MEFTIELPASGDAADGVNAATLARTAETAGFYAIGYTDHPAPSAKWLRSGGHATFDPFAALSFIAAVTHRVRLMTYLAVLPYRNPMLLAKSVATVDRLSGGRFTLVCGTGYLRSEFAAVGRSFEHRNETFETAIDVIRRVYTDDEFTYVGDDFEARGVIHDPRPVQLPHPPIWIGGSSRASRRRVARYGSGWAPLLTTEAFARTVRTGQLSSNDDLRAAISDLHELTSAEGRDPADLSVQLDGFGPIDASDDALARAAELEALGVTHVVVRPPHGPVAAAVEALERFGAEVISKSRSR